MLRLFFPLLFSCLPCFAQGPWPHPNAHAHNDYLHRRPLHEALENGFVSIEADVHLKKGKLLVAHEHTTAHSPTLETLYFIPLDSVIKRNGGFVYAGSKTPLYLMVDSKTEGEATYQALKELLNHYPRLRCTASGCAVKIFLSGERPRAAMIKEGYNGFGIDGRPDDVGKGFSPELMPVISDTYANWSTSKKATPDDNDLQRIKDLARRVHSEGKKLRLWAIPDNELAWKGLLNAGVDLINTDQLHELHTFLSNNGL